MGEDSQDFRMQVFSKAFIPEHEGDMPPPPPASAPTVSGRDAVLLRMQKDIFTFYKKYHPQKLRKSILALAMQIWWDNGLLFLNHFLTEKYGLGLEVFEDYLDGFDRQGEDITVVSKHELNIAAANKHLMVSAVVKTNSANYFRMDRSVNTKTFADRREARDNLGNNPVPSLFQDVKFNSSSENSPQGTQTLILEQTAPVAPHTEDNKADSSDEYDSEED